MVANPDIAPANNVCSLSVGVGGDPTVSIFFREAGERIYQQQQMIRADGQPVFDVAIPANNINLRGLEYYFRAVENGMVSYLPETDHDIYPYRLKTSVSDYAMQGIEDSTWQMIGFPYDISPNDFASVFGDNLGMSGGENWRIAKWNAAGGEYMLDSANSTIARNQGYWFWTYNPVSIDAGGFSPFPDTFMVEDSLWYADISINQGWNQISAPFPVPILWSTCKADYGIENALWEYSSGYGLTSSYVLADTLKPFEGYWVNNEASGTRHIYVPLRRAPISQPVAKTNIKNENEWQTNIALSCGKIQDRANIIGFKTDALDSYDRYDLSEPPVCPGDYVSMAFINSSEQGKKVLLSGDYRPLSSRVTNYEVIMKSNLNRPAHLNLTDTMSIPDNIMFVLYDTRRDNAYEIKRGKKLTLPDIPTPDGIKYNLIVGDKNYIELQGLELSLMPDRFQVGQNYPNPFNPSTRIDFSLPVPQKTELEIYNILGQKIRTLVDEQLPAGNHSYQWDGVNDEGRSVGSGIYFYRLKTEKFTGSKKMMLVK